MSYNVPSFALERTSLPQSSAPDFSSSSNNASTSNPPRECSFPVEHCSDKLLQLLIEKGLVDETGTMLTDLFPLPLNKIYPNLLVFLEVERSVAFKDANGNEFKFAYTLKELQEYLSNQTHLPKSTRHEIVGGAAISLLGLNYFIDNMKTWGIDQPEEYLSQEFLKVFKEHLNDEDIREFYENCNWRLLDLVGTSRIQFFVTKLKKNYPHYSEEELFDLVEKNALQKLNHFPQKQNELRSDKALHYYVVAPKDSCNTEFCLISKMPREHLFIHDALGINFSGMLPLVPNPPFLRSDLGTPCTAMLNRLLGIIDADNVEEIDHNGWPLYIYHLLHGKICLKEGVEVSLTKHFFNLLLQNPDANFLKSIITNIFKNHKRNLQSSSLQEAMVFYILNALFVAHRHYKKEDFNKIRSLLIDMLPGGEEYSICGFISKLLKRQSLSFELVSAHLELFVLNLYKNEQSGTEQDPKVLMRKHGGNLVFQLSLQKDHLKSCLLVPFQPLRTLQTLAEHYNELKENDIEELGELYSLFRKHRDAYQSTHRLESYVNTDSLDLISLEPYVWNLFSAISPMLYPALEDFMEVYSSQKQQLFSLNAYLEILPQLVRSCNCYDKRSTVRYFTSRVFTENHICFSESALIGMFVEHPVDNEESNNIILSQLALMLFKSGDTRVLKQAWRFFKESNRTNWSEFVEVCIKLRPDIALEAFEYAHQNAIINEEESRKCLSLLMHSPISFDSLLKYNPRDLVELLVAHKIKNPEIWCNVIETISRGSDSVLKRDTYHILQGRLAEWQVFHPKQPKLLERVEKASESFYACLTAKECHESVQKRVNDPKFIAVSMGMVKTDSQFWKSFELDYCCLTQTYLKSLTLPLTLEDHAVLMDFLDYRSHVHCHFYSSKSAEIDLQLLAMFKQNKETHIQLLMWDSLKHILTLYDTLEIGQMEKSRIITYYHDLLKIASELQDSELLQNEFFSGHFQRVSIEMLNKWPQNVNIPMMNSVLRQIPQKPNQPAVNIYREIENMVKCKRVINLSKHYASIKAMLEHFITCSCFDTVDALLNLTCINEMFVHEGAQQPVISAAASKKKKVTTAKARGIPSVKFGGLTEIRAKYVEQILSVLEKRSAEDVIKDEDQCLKGFINYICTFMQSKEQLQYWMRFLKVIFNTAEESGDLNFLQTAINGVFYEVYDFLSMVSKVNSNVASGKHHKLGLEENQSGTPVGSSTQSYPGNDIDYCTSLFKFHLSFPDIVNNWIMPMLTNMIMRNSEHREIELYMNQTSFRILHTFLSGFTTFGPHQQPYVAQLFIYLLNAQTFNSDPQVYKLSYENSLKLFSTRGFKIPSLMLLKGQIAHMFKAELTNAKPRFFLIPLELYKKIFTDWLMIDSNPFSLLSLAIVRIFKFVQSEKHFDFQGRYYPEHLVDIVTNNQINENHTQYIPLVDYQQKILIQLMEINHSEPHLLKAHSDSLIRLIMKLYSNGGFRSNWQLFVDSMNYTLSQLARLKNCDNADYVKFASDKSSTLTRFCSLGLPINKGAKGELDENQGLFKLIH